MFRMRHDPPISADGTVFIVGTEKMSFVWSSGQEVIVFCLFVFFLANGIAACPAEPRSFEGPLPG